MNSDKIEPRTIKTMGRGVSNPGLLGPWENKIVLKNYLIHKGLEKSKSGHTDKHLIMSQIIKELDVPMFHHKLSPFR